MVQTSHSWMGTARLQRRQKDNRPRNLQLTGELPPPEFSIARKSACNLCGGVFEYWRPEECAAGRFVLVSAVVGGLFGD